MNRMWNYYNNSRHETLTQTLFTAHPELKQTYPNGISPKIMNDNYALERLFVIECKKNIIIILLLNQIINLIRIKKLKFIMNITILKKEEH